MYVYCTLRVLKYQKAMIHILYIKLSHVKVVRAHITVFMYVFRISPKHLVPTSSSDPTF